MRAIDAFDPASGVRLAGVLDVEPAGEGMRLRRLPPWTREQLLDPSARFVATMASGLRIQLTTDTTAIEIDAMLTRLQVGEQPIAPAVFDLVVDRDLVASQTVTDGGRIIWTDPRTLGFEVRRGPAVTVRFDGLAPHTKVIEMWLPHTASVELRGLRIDDGASIEPTQVSGQRWVHYGSSISQCGEALRPTNVWPVVTARRVGADLTSLGFGGQCHLDQYVARTIRDLDVDAISLKLGINVINGDTMRERTFLSAAQGFLDTVRDGHASTPIAVVTPIVCPAAEDHPGPTVAGRDGVFGVVPRPPELSVGALSLRRVRDLLADVVNARQAAGDEHIHLVDGLGLFGPDDVADLPDGLHPNDAGYVRMGERFAAVAFGDRGPFAE